MIIDAHVHLWKKQAGLVDGLPVYPLENGRSMLKGEVRQMLPPYMTDNRNTARRLIANMDFAQVNGAVVTQEYMDGNQDAYLRYARRTYPDRLRVCALYEEKGGKEAGKIFFTDIAAPAFQAVEVCVSEAFMNGDAKKPEFAENVKDGFLKAPLKDIVDVMLENQPSGTPRP